tara:strand:- start:2531 stop:2797 length:267 start_codon:yes stop_codon:yes gene_type:complete
LLIFDLLQALGPLVPQEVFETKLLPLISKLAADPVPNIRFNVAKAIMELKECFTQESRSQILVCLKMMTNDADADVTYYATQAIETLQ